MNSPVFKANSDNHPPVITFDGLSGSGKGTIGRLLAQQLGWHFLDSGALYRAVGWAAQQQQTDGLDEQELISMLAELDIKISTNAEQDLSLICHEQEIAHCIRDEACGDMASKLSALPAVRAYLLQAQRDTRQMPGLVADGRDMGTVVFPDAELKFYLDAGAKQRAERRYWQLKNKGIHVSLQHVRQEIDERDQRDQARSIAPAKAAPDAIHLDTSELSVEEALDCVLNHVRGYR